MKGFQQVQGVEYDEIFSLVSKLKSVLNGYLKEELYMIPPEGFVDPKGAKKVRKLQRSIYGLVQASQSWNICFDKVIKTYGF